MPNAEHVELVRAGSHATWESRLVRLDLRNAELSGIVLRGANLQRADLRGARLVGSDLSGCRLHEADLATAHLMKAKLDAAQLGGADLSRALFCSATMAAANMVRTNLSGANLSQARLEQANLSFSRIGGAIFNGTNLVDARLDGVEGLGEIQHEGPSELGTHTLLKFGKELPEEFLLGIGLPNSFIRYLPSIVDGARPIDFFALFVQTTRDDIELAGRIYTDLRNQGLRCWLRCCDQTEVDQMLRLNDRSIIVWSGSASAALRQTLQSCKPSRSIIAKADQTPLPRSLDSDFPIVDFSEWLSFPKYTDAIERLLARIQ